MNVFEAIKDRRSIRRFAKSGIPEEMTERLIDALIWAPSAGNLQARKFYFISDPEVQSALASAALDQSFIAKAPLVVVGCTDDRIVDRYGRRGVELYTIQDVSCSIMCMMLAAHEMGLGTVWTGAFHEDIVAEILCLPGSFRP
ncbi:MAG TPA: nitroreductase family protein, partial [Nitrospirae bacterium]|nr:nitroreductase family protein [Nitrospirota bacterium]